MAKEDEICPVKDCQNPATVKFGPLKVCWQCFDKCAYDMQPLILKPTEKVEDKQEALSEEKQDD